MIAASFGATPSTPLWQPGFVTQPGNSTTGGFTAGTLRISPILVPNRCRIIALIAEVTAIGDAASLLRLGMWASDSSGSFPKRLVSPAAGTTVAGDAVGFNSAAVNFVVDPGIYWVGMTTEASATAVTVRACTGSTMTATATGAATTANGYSYSGQSAGPFSDLSGAAAGYTATVPKMSFQIGVL